MLENLISNTSPLVFFIGIIGYFVKTILHYNYLKRTNKNLENLNFLEFFGQFKYRSEAIEAMLPFFLKKKNTESLPEEDREECEQLEKYIKICLWIFYIGFIYMALAVFLNEK